MKRFFTIAVFSAACLTAGFASAATVVYNPSAVSPPAPANKVTNTVISPGDFVTETEILSPGDTAEFILTAVGDLTIDAFSFSGTGNNFGDDLANVKFGFTPTPTNSFTSINVFGNTASATATLPGLSLLDGESFTIYWDDGLIAPIGVTASFTVSSPSAIPVPAALPLLIGAIGLLGFVRSRSRT